MRLMVRLYPAAWRARYEDEFLAVLEERPLSPFDVVDIALGALDARLRPRSLAVEIELTPRRSHPMQARIAGYAAIAGGPLMLLSFPLSAPILFAFGALALLVALVGLSAAQGRRSPGVTWAAVVIPVVGLFVSIVGAVGMAVSSDGPFIGAFSPWDVWIVGTIGLVIGSALYATATLYVGVLSRSGAIALLAGSVAMTLVVLLSMAGLGEGGDTPLTAIASVAALVLFCAGWMWLGYAAAIRPRIEVSTGAS